jgi:hypothetical protein
MGDKMRAMLSWVERENVFLTDNTIREDILMDAPELVQKECKESQGVTLPRWIFSPKFLSIAIATVAIGFFEPVGLLFLAASLFSLDIIVKWASEWKAGNWTNSDGQLIPSTKLKLPFGNLRELQLNVDQTFGVDIWRKLQQPPVYRVWFYNIPIL